MRVVVDHLSDEEVRAVAVEHGRDVSGYAPADLALFKFKQACVTAAAELDEASKGVEDAPLAPPSVAGEPRLVDGDAGFDQDVHRRTDVFPGGGEE
jgi:hypothetical protein